MPKQRYTKPGTKPGTKPEVVDSTQRNSCTQDQSFIPIGIIVGPLLTLINVMVSSSANDAFVKDVSDNNVYGKALKPGEEITGFLVFRDAGTAPITARLKK